jgi:hypothetical protein
MVIQGEGVREREVSKTPSQPINAAWWYVPVIPAKWKAVGRRTEFLGCPRQKYENLLEK